MCFSDDSYIHQFFCSFGSVSIPVFVFIYPRMCSLLWAFFIGVWVPVCLCLYASVCLYFGMLKSCYFYGFPCATIVQFCLFRPMDTFALFMFISIVYRNFQMNYYCVGMCVCVCDCDCDSNSETMATATITIQEYKNRTCGHGKKRAARHTNYM